MRRYRRRLRQVQITGASIALASLFRPATDAPARASAGVAAALRILAGLLWLYNVSWKRPPDFGKDSGNGLYGFTQDAVDHPVLPPFSWLVETIVLPNFAFFGWGVLVVETLLAVLLLTGTLVRLAAIVGVVQSLSIGLSVAQTPGEWPWSYWLMIGVHVVLLFTAAGRIAAVDAVRGAAQSRRHTGELAAHRLAGGWGIVVLLTAVLAVALSMGDDPSAPSGATLGGPGLSLSLGSYNLIGAVVLAVVAALMLAATTLHSRMLAVAAGVVAAVAAASLYAQLGRTDAWLGGSNTSAAFFLCAAVVSFATAGQLGRTRRQSRTAARAVGG